MKPTRQDSPSLEGALSVFASSDTLALNTLSRSNDSINVAYLWCIFLRLLLIKTKVPVETLFIFSGAACRNRTDDLRVTNPLL